MTVSNNAQNRWFFYRTAIAILICLAVFRPQNAKAQITLNDTPACVILIATTAGFTLSKLPRTVPTGYQIVRRSHPPEKTFKPGDRYQIRYAINTSPSKLHSCMDVGTHDLTMAAQVHRQGWPLISALPHGIGESALSDVATIIGKVRIERFDNGSSKWFTANFTVPNMEEIVGNTETFNVIMWVCPPNIKAVGCHGHVIKVQNQSTPGWTVSRLTPRVRAIGVGVNPVAPNRLIPLSAVITQVRGWPLTLSQSPKAYIKQVSAPGLVAAGPPPTQTVPGLGGGKSATMQFQAGPLIPGVHIYQACLKDLPPRPNGWPVAEICGPQTTLTAIEGKVRPTPQPAAPVANTCTGGRVFDRSQGRCICEGDLFWNPGLKRCYQCTRGRNWNASQNRCICPSGTAWNQRANRCAPPTSTRCTGGRAANAQGRCVCPTGSFWNPNPGFKRCYTCTAGRIWNGNQRRCVCPPGVKWNQRANRCGAAFQAVPTPQVRLPGLGTPAKITCTGGRVSNRACLCPRGFTRKTIRANVYLCKPPLRRPVPNAMGNRLKTPKTNKMRCIGGQVKGPLCWCGIGRFPKKIGSNAYRCQ